MKTARGESSDKKLLVVLCVLVLAIAVLCIVVVVRGDLTNKNIGSNNGNGVADECSLGDFDEAMACIDESYLESGDVDKYASVYDGVISQAQNQDNYELAARLEVQKAISLVNYGYCDEAIWILNEDDFSGYENKYLAYIYSEATGIALSCDNAEMRDKWMDLMMKSQEGAEYEEF